MREIKFRAWHKNENAMLFAGDDYGTKNGIECCVYVLQGQPVELMQYTGLKDKNGVEIYEGDIVIQHAEWDVISCGLDGWSGSESFEAEYLGCVSITASKGTVINRALFRDIIKVDAEWKKHPHSVKLSGKRSEVIGNIYQNPELLNN